MKVRIAVDSLLELAGAALATWGLDVLAGSGAAIMTAAVATIVLAEFSFSGHVWTVRRPNIRFPRRRRKPSGDA